MFHDSFEQTGFMSVAGCVTSAG